TLSNFDSNGLKVAQEFSSVPLAPEPNETSDNGNEQVWALDDGATASVLPKIERIDPHGPTLPLINEGSACNQASKPIKNKKSTDEFSTNAKLNFLALQMRNFKIQNFQNIGNELCREAQWHMDPAWQSLQLDATSFLQQGDIIAQFTGDALTIWPCRQVNASPIYKNHKINGTCYEYMPAIVEEQPGGEDLLALSQRVDCTKQYTLTKLTKPSKLKRAPYM
uniref:Uncharacterized protein n=1 Tax=Romanomermis culicivorax TaxID=13658 RepID=A0A915KYX5_ROMCU